MGRPVRLRALVDLGAGLGEPDFERPQPLLQAKLIRLRLGLRVLRALQCIPQLRDVAHRPLELPNDHGDPLVGFGLELFGGLLKHVLRDPHIHPMREPRQPRASREGAAQPERHHAIGLAQEGRHREAQDDQGDPRDGPLSPGSGVRLMLLSPLLMGVAESAVASAFGSLGLHCSSRVLGQEARAGGATVHPTNGGGRQSPPVWGSTSGV